ncbi:nickel pincer cofactor biosynthesis protein LarC [Edaphobacter sp. 12200R-103]|uniref:nickel pincer cofactor biosynthesis protein LarC n=1 Tax=Edaphobacter sp. 12200R-103 TaxID=2703788 RepID=UPI00138D6CE3|nr:nickel pincer cofactor biosynthesis protein LarC [Edaphobacter sp. 12200R-103]QHS51439.1 nickel pincer cofactor biosynthesis protein LarC [Edaphobacter sp. 12200R-103]
MRIAYLDCFAGVSGDMFLGALVSAGVPADVLHQAVDVLNVGASLEMGTVDRSGISSTSVRVLEAGRPADQATHSHSHAEQHHPYHDDHQHAHSHEHSHTHSHNHEHSHSHEHEHHEHAHGRSLSAIRKLIEAAKLPDAVKQTAIHAFELLGASEAKIHNVDIEKIHFHEVGAVDAIVDIVAASAGIHALGVNAWYCSPLNVGGGMVDCAHGCFPVPAPATADLLRDVPTYSAHVQQELVTPTGAALIRAISPTFGPQPAMRVQNIGYGAGTRNPKDFPNVLRLSVGETAGASHSAVAVLETAVDDISPQILAYVTERALALGALDVMSTAVQMKKGRMGTHLTVLADDAKVAALEDLLLRETSTLGVRIHHERRSCLDRDHVTVTTPYGEIRMKIGSRSGEIYNVAPEFEDCRLAAEAKGVPVKVVQQSAIAAYQAQQGSK